MCSGEEYAEVCSRLIVDHMNAGLDSVAPFRDVPSRARRDDRAWTTTKLRELEKECVRAHKNFIRRKFNMANLCQFREFRLESQRLNSKLLNGFISRSLGRCRTSAQRWRVLERQGVVKNMSKAVLDIPEEFAAFLLDLQGPPDPVGDLHENLSRVTSRIAPRSSTFLISTRNVS